MVDNQILILSEVIVKLFVDTEHRLPSDDKDTEVMELAILKTYKSALLAQQKINSFNK
jgi:hypothetical protein